MGKEKTWIKLDLDTVNLEETNRLLQISQDEWASVHGLVKERIDSGDTPPFMMSRKTAKPKIGKIVKLTHSFIVLPNKDGSYKVGAMARAQAYIRSGTKSEMVREGILGSGRLSHVKLVQWEKSEDGIDAVKIRAVDKTGEEIEEEQILRNLGYLRAAFTRHRKKATPWIGKQKIGNKRYIVQQFGFGMSMEDYFKSFVTAVKETPMLQRCILALKSAEVVEQLHERGIIHADIKPPNFMVNIQEKVITVFPIDFDVSKQLSKGQTIIKAKPHGTLGYVAPEMGEIKEDSSGKYRFTNKIGFYSKAIDVYSLGMLFGGNLKLLENKSPPILGELLCQMVDDDPQKRPSIHEVVTIMKNPENYHEFVESYEILNDYAKRRPGEVKELEEILGDHRSALLIAKNTQGKQSLMDDTTKKILTIMEKIQAKHKAKASLFNIKFLRSLPKELREDVCKKLDIDSQEIMKKGQSRVEILATKLSRSSELKEENKNKVVTTTYKL